MRVFPVVFYCFSACDENPQLHARGLPLEVYQSVRLRTVAFVYYLKAVGMYDVIRIYVDTIIK